MASGFLSRGRVKKSAAARKRCAICWHGSCQNLPVPFKQCLNVGALTRTERKSFHETIKTDDIDHDGWSRGAAKLRGYNQRGAKLKHPALWCHPGRKLQQQQRGSDPGGFCPGGHEA